MRKKKLSNILDQTDTNRQISFLFSFRLPISKRRRTILPQKHAHTPTRSCLRVKRTTPSRGHSLRPNTPFTASWMVYRSVQAKISLKWVSFRGYFPESNEKTEVRVAVHIKRQLPLANAFELVLC